MTRVFLILALALSPPIAQKKRDWIDGKVTEVNYRREMEGPSVSATGAGTGGSVSYKDYFTYTVEANGTRYTLEEQATKPRFKESEVIKFAIEKKNWFVIDEKGKEKKGDLKGTKKIGGSE